jgi:hypothetical protein
MGIVKTHDVYGNTTLVDQTVRREPGFPLPLPAIFALLELFMHYPLEFPFQRPCFLPFPAKVRPKWP